MKTNNDVAASRVKEGLQKRSHFRWFILALMFIYYIVNFADRANIGVVLPQIMKEFNLTNLQAGSVAGIFFLGYAIIQVPAGLVMGRIGARVLTSVSLFIFSACTFLIGCAPGPAFMKWCRLGLGLGEGPAGIGAGSLVKAWFPRKEQATASGIYFSGSQVAQVIVPPLCVLIMVTLGWRWVFYICAIPGVIISIIWYVFVRNRPEQSSFCNEQEREYITKSESTEQAPVKDDPQAKSLGWFDTFLRVRRGLQALRTPGEIFRSWNIWATCLIFFFSGMATFGMMSWLPSYLVNERHLPMITMGILTAIPNVGSVLGLLLGGWLSDRVFSGRRKPIMFITSICGFIMMFLLANAPADQTILILLLFFNGLLINTSSSVNISYPMGLTTNKTFPIVLGMCSTSAALGGFASPMIAGRMLDVFKSFTPVFYMFGIALALIFVFAMTIIEPLQTVGTRE